MNTSFFNSMKRIFFYSVTEPFKGMKIVLKPKITGLIIIAFASVLIIGCNNDNNGGAKKTDPATQSNGQRSEGEGEDDRGRDSSHRGMDMDSSHPGNHK